jgi:excinuclease UvrABC nuclease subunit
MLMFNPHGCFVYFLMDKKGETLYVGTSTNILARLGSHMGDSHKRGRVGAVSVMAYGPVNKENRGRMLFAERMFIGLHQPPWNIIGVPAATLRARRRLTNDQDAA